MTQWQDQGKTKPSGGKKNSINYRDKRLCHRGGIPAHTTVSEKTSVDSYRIRGGKVKMASLNVRYAQVTDRTGKKIKAEIIEVTENNANRQFTRRNIVTKGAVIKVRIGEKEEYVKVTSRPGQDANINGIVVEREEEAKTRAGLKKRIKKPAKNKEKDVKQSQKTVS
jgi:small subunit ribosomal protein S8e